MDDGGSRCDCAVVGVRSPFRMNFAMAFFPSAPWWLALVGQVRCGGHWAAGGGGGVAVWSGGAAVVRSSSGAEGRQWWW